MSFFRPSLLFSLPLVLCSGFVLAAPPTTPEAKKIYDHDYEWLANAQVNFIAANIRGANDEQYRERRQAALDLLKVKKDLTTIPEMMDELRRRSFLSAEICEIFGEWKSKKTVPLLTEVAADEKRPKDVREKAAAAIQAIKTAPAEAPPPSYESH